MNDSITDQNYEIFHGLHVAMTRSQGVAENFYFKVVEAQKQYFDNAHERNSRYIELAGSTLDEALQKFYFGTFSLEKLWGVHNYLRVTDHGLPISAEKRVTSQHNEIEFLQSALFDHALYEWRSFLDYYLKYLLCFCTGKLEEKISTRKFSTGMERAVKANDIRAKKVLGYIKVNVLNTTYGGDKRCWGDTLRELRDKTSHQKVLRPTIVKRKNMIGYEIGWPTINGRDLAELAQSFQNDPFLMIIELFPILYGFQWISGGFRPGMFRK